jgi:transposase-like protein
MSAAAAVRMDRARARRLTDQLRDALELSVTLLREAHAGEAWRVLGYPSWAAYCAAELPALAILVRGMPAEKRRPVVAEARGSGMSLAAVADAFGLAPNTVKRDAAAAGVVLAEVRRISDGALVPARSAAPVVRRRPLTERIVTALRAAEGGLTVAEVAAELRAERHRVAPALTRLAEAGRIDYVAPERRGLFGRYVAGRMPR